MTTSLVLPDRQRSVALYGNITDPLAFINSLGDDFLASGMFGCANKQQGRVLAMAVVAENKSPIELARVYHIMDGKLSMRSDAMLAEFRARGGKHRQIQRDADAAEIELSMDGEAQRYRLTWIEAQQEPYVWGKSDAKGNRAIKYNWSTPRSRMQMLWARVVSDGVRAMAPEVVAGYYTPEEIDDSEGHDEPAKRASRRAPVASTNGAAAVVPSSPQATTEQAPFDDGVIDASFEVSPTQNPAVEPGTSPPVQATSSVADQSPPAPAADPIPAGVATGGTSGQSMLETDPCTQVQVNQIRSLINDIATVDPGIVEKIKKQLASTGREKIAELNWKEAQGLFQALTQKAHQVFAEQALAKGHGDEGGESKK